MDSSILNKDQNLNSENQYSPKEKFYTDKKFPSGLLATNGNAIKLDDLASKVLKRTSDLIARPVDHKSEADLTRNILDIGVSWFKYVQILFKAII